MLVNISSNFRISLLCVGLRMKDGIKNGKTLFLDGIIAGRTDDCGKHSELGDKAYTISIDIREHSLILLPVSLGIASHTSPGGQASSLSIEVSLEA